MAAVAAMAEKTANVNNEEQLVTMIVDRQLFGIPILQVQDIVEATKITPVPLSTSAIAGMLNLRGRIVTVIDLRKLLGNDEEVPWASQMGVTVEYRGDLYTLLVDAIGDVRSVRRSDFDKAPSTLEPETRRLCSGIYRLQGSLLVVLEVSRILTPEVIAATQVLTVAERRLRKANALEAAKGDENQARQLSSHMTGLTGYEVVSETETGVESSDDIKRRKKENRNRRPVAERWREAMEERARRTGQSVYRMREPDEETLDAAREEMEAEDAAWQSRAKGGDPAESGSDVVPGDLGELPDDMFSEEAFSELPASDEPDLTGFLPDEMLSDEPVSDEPVSDEPLAGDEVAASGFDELPADDMAPVTDESGADIVADPVADEPATAYSPEMPEDEQEPDDGESARVDMPEMKMDEPAVEDVTESTDDTVATPEMLKILEDGDAPTRIDDAADDGKSSMLSGFWNKLRGPEKKAGETAFGEPAAADEDGIFDDMPASDEAPVDNDMIAGDEPATARKPAKSRSKKKAPAKRKSKKSDDS